MRLPWIAFLWPLLAGASEPMKVAPFSPQPHVQRIADAGRLWSRLQWVHPALADGRIDWDLALLDALPAIAAADSDTAKVAALQLLLAPLNDEVARVGARPAPIYVKASDAPPSAQVLADGTLLVTAHRLSAPWGDEFAPRIESLRFARPLRRPAR